MHPLHLLLLDDHPVTLAGLAAELASDESLHIACQCRSVAEAQRALQHSKIDVVITDLYLADGQTGLDLVTQMHERGLLTPVIVLSSDERPAIVRQALALGVAAYLTKYSEGKAIKQAVRWVTQPQNQQQVYLWPPALRQRVFDDAMAMPAPPAVLIKLTGREKEVLCLFGKGAEPKEIAKTFALALPTVYSHLQSIRRKLNLSNEVELRNFGLRYLTADAVSQETGTVTSVRKPPSGRLPTESVPPN